MRKINLTARAGRKSAVLTVAAIGAALALGLSACGSTGSGDTAAGGDSSGSSAPVSGGTLVAALSGDPQTLDIAQNSSALAIYVSQNVFEQLFTIDGTYTPRPMLADSFSMSDDGLTYTIPLRKGVKFSNGKEMTADDVVASLERWEEVSGAGKLVKADVTAMTAKDPNTVEIKLNKPRYSLIADLAGNLNAAIIVPADIAKAAGAQPMKDDQIIGTGPYKVATYTHGQEIDLEKNADYSSRTETDWGGFAGAKKAYFDKIQYKFVTDPTQQLNGIKSGQFQWAQSVAPDQYTAIKDDPTLNVKVSDFGLINTYLLNQDAASPFKDLKARQALNMLMDKNAIATAAYGPKELWSPPSGSMALPIDKPMYSAAGEDVYKKLDPAGAKALFAEAGVTADKPIRIATTQTYPKYYQMAVVLQAELEKIGLKAKIDVYDFPTMIDKLTASPDAWDISMTGFNGAVGSPSQLLYLTPTWPGEYKSAKMDGLLAEYNKSKTQDDALKIVDQIQQTLWDEIPVIPVAPLKIMLVSSNKVHDLSTFNQAIFWGAYLAK